MILNLEEKIISHVKLFIRFSAKIEDFEALVNYLKDFALNGISNKKIQTLSKMTNETELDVQYGIQGIFKVMEEAANLNLKEDELKDTLKIVGLSNKMVVLLLPFYKDTLPHIWKLNSVKDIKTRTFKDLKWRIDIQLSSKSVSNNTQPIVYLHIITVNPDTEEEETKIFQTDPCNIRHLIAELEMAQKEFESVYYRRIEKYIK